MLYPQSQALAILTFLLFLRLPSVMAKNLSVPLAFACLLHLANEKVSAVHVCEVSRSSGQSTQHFIFTSESYNKSHFVFIVNTNQVDVLEIKSTVFPA